MTFQTGSKGEILACQCFLGPLLFVTQLVILEHHNENTAESESSFPGDVA